MNKIVKFGLIDILNDSRDKREILTLENMGCEVIALFLSNGIKKEQVEGYKIKQVDKLNLTYLQFKPLRIIKIVFYFLKLAKVLRKMKADCISCHDIKALLIGWFSTCFVSKNKKPLLVYDSHEFEIGRNTEGKRGKCAQYIVKKMERFLIKKCAFSMMVNDSIAGEVQKIHDLKVKPIVIRNIPNYWNGDERICKKRRREFLQQLGMSDFTTFIVMYHGVIMPNRGIENILISIQRTNNIVVVILGNGKTSYLEHLKQLTKELQISDRVLFHNAVNINSLWEYVGAVDVGMIIHPNVSMSYYFGLPNKFFENIQSMTPIIGSNFPEISRIVNKYDIGLLINPENINEIVNAVEKMRTDKEMYCKFKNNLKQAKEDLCWENERKVLEEMYVKILDKRDTNDNKLS